MISDIMRKQLSSNELLGLKNYLCFWQWKTVWRKTLPLSPPPKSFIRLSEYFSFLRNGVGFLDQCRVLKIAT